MTDTEAAPEVEPADEAKLSPTDAIQKRMNDLAPELFRVNIMDMWLIILWEAHHDEDDETEIDNPDFEGTCFDGAVLEPLAQMMMPALGLETLSTTQLQSMIEEVIHDDLARYGLTLKWCRLEEGLQYATNLYVFPK